MFTKTKNNDTQTLKDQIDSVLSQMNSLMADTDEYNTMLNQLERLYKLSTDEVKKRVSPDALVAAGASLAGILIIVAYEHSHVVTSKALGFVLKAKS